MNIVRYILLFTVIVDHVIALAGNVIQLPIAYFAVGGFFALSGFLMYPYCMHQGSFRKYIGRRAKRLLPSYIFIVLLCAFGLSYVSVLSPAAYFSSPELWKYIAANLCCLNWLHPDLPGVFEGFESRAVNGALWTMKVEWCLSISVPIFIRIAHKIKDRKCTLAVCVVIFSMIWRIILLYLFTINEKPIYEILSRQILGQLSYFYCGMLVYFYQDFLKKHIAWMLISGAIFYLISNIHWTLQCILNPLGLSLFLLGICFLPVNINFLSRYTVISYEMYLFHCPIIQLSVLWGINHISTLAEYAFVFSATILLSIFANHFLRWLLPFTKRKKNKEAVAT